MRQLDEGFPVVDIPIEGIEDFDSLKESLRSLLLVVRGLKADYTEAINYNAVTEVTQATRPTPETGRMLVWNDSDATAGQPTHYLVYNFAGTVVTFASEETV